MSQAASKGSGERSARVNRDADGVPLGAMMFLTDQDLRDLGVDPDEADSVVYSVHDGSIRLAAAGETA